MKSLLNPTLQQRIAYGAELHREAVRPKLDQLLERFGTDEVMEGLVALEECFEETPLRSSALLF